MKTSFTQLPPPNLSLRYSAEYNNSPKTWGNLALLPGNEALENAVITKRMYCKVFNVIRE